MTLLNHNIYYILSVLSLYALSFTTVIVAFIHKKRHRALSHLFIYPLASFLEITISGILDGLDILGFTVTERLSAMSIHIFVIIEFTCVYLFFLKSEIITGLSKKALSILFISFLVLYSLRWLTTLDFLLKYEKIYFLESCFILLPCFTYIYQLFAKPPILNLLNEPSFWFNAGILIYLTLTLPIFLVPGLLKTKLLFEFANLCNIWGYSIVFSFLIKAFLCKPTKTI